MPGQHPFHRPASKLSRDCFSDMVKNNLDLGRKLCNFFSLSPIVFCGYTFLLDDCILGGNITDLLKKNPEFSLWLDPQHSPVPAASRSRSIPIPKKCISNGLLLRLSHCGRYFFTSKHGHPQEDVKHRREKYTADELSNCPALGYLGNEHTCN